MFKIVLPVIVVVVAILRWKRSRPRHPPLPPGPPADPLIGHIRSFPTGSPDVTFAEWGRKYGDVLHLSVFGKSFIILNSHRAATDLLEKRSAKYSSRPTFTVQEMIEWTGGLPLLPSGEQFLRQRKLFQHTFSRQESQEFLTIEREQALVLLKNLYQKPEKAFHHASRFVSAVIMQITYAYEITSDDDPYVESMDQINHAVAELGTNPLLMIFPPLKYLIPWLPEKGFVKVVRTAAAISQRVKNEPFDQVRRDMATRDVRACFASTQLEELERQGGASERDIEDLKVAALMMYIAGGETTSSTITNFYAAMILFPKVQAKAQAEIDAVIGMNRLPYFDDRTSLPYVEAVMYEVMRWRPTLPLGVPRFTTAEDVYKGMYIPEGATVIANNTGMALDESVYRDPQVFRPERYLGPSAEPPPTEFFFGFGRRICPGRYLADNSLWIVIATILTTFEILPQEDDSGNRAIPDIKFTLSTTNHPEPFPCQFRPRSEKMREILEKM